MDGSPFADRREAGRELAQVLLDRNPANPVVLALPRGGVPVAAEIAGTLDAPLDLLFVRKIGLPGRPEVAVAAVVDGDPPEVIVNEDILAATATGRDWIDGQVPAAVAETERRRRAYLHGRRPLSVVGRTAIVVDDGVATGASMRAALKALSRRGPAALVVAVPVAAAETLRELRDGVDEVICLAVPEPFIAISLHYIDFHQLDDREVLDLLDAPVAGRRSAAP